MKTLSFLMTMLSILLFPMAAPLSAFQGLHPAKAAFADAQSWPATVPGDLSLQNFRPYRAVYQRWYTQGLGGGAGEERTDQVIIEMQEAAFDGKPTVTITVLDSGNPEFADTNGRAQFEYVNPATLELQHLLGPVSGTSRDYNVIRILDDRLVMTAANTETGEVETQSVPIEQVESMTGARAMFPSEEFLLYPQLPLEVGYQIHLVPVFSPVAQSVVPMTARVKSRETITDDTGTTRDTWLVESMGVRNPASARIDHYYVINEPPYLIWRSVHDVETGEDDWYWKLIEFEYLDR